MKFHTSTTRYHCGVDLHSRQMYVCVMDSQGNKLLHMNIKNNDFEFFLKKIEPWRHDMTVCCECLFCWYWFADACREAGLTFVLAHALYLKAIHGGKNKNDRIDSEKLANLLRGNLIPPSYVYPTAKRPIRDLLRQRASYVWQRVELLQRISTRQMARGDCPVSKFSNNREKWLEALLESTKDPRQRFSFQQDVQLVIQYDNAIKELEKELLRITKREQPRDFALLRSIPGVGKTLALTILYEVESIDRFASAQNFLSYCRLVKGTVSSAGKIKGLRGAKLGNPYLRWALGEAAVLGKRHHEDLDAYSRRLETKHGKFKGTAILASKLGRAVYFMLKNGKTFDLNQLIGASPKTI
ncbi:MAG: IS110 family transposase [Verrucomicrobiae bacterium]|nr:IS110 family transposase [Verrucomicrobiae bacterium]